MADPSPAVDEASPSPSTTAITDLNEDAVAHCALNLSLQDISNMAMSCKLLKHVAYSDSVWQRLFRFLWIIFWFLLVFCKIACCPCVSFEKYWFFLGNKLTFFWKVENFCWRAYYAIGAKNWSGRFCLMSYISFFGYVGNNGHKC